MVEAEVAGELQRVLGATQQVHLGTGGAREHRDQQPDRPGPSTSTRSPGPQAAASAARSALPPGSTSAPRTGSTASGSGCSECRNGQLLGQRAGAAAADPDLLPVLADVLVAAPAAAADAVAEHRVAHDPAPEPGGVDAVADGGDGRHHSCPSRIG